MTDHLPALAVLLYLPVAVVGLLFAIDAGARRQVAVAQRLLDLYQSASGSTKVAALLLAMTGTMHLGLASTHLDEPVTALLFAIDGMALLGFSGFVFLRGAMRVAATGLLAASVGAYAFYLLVGLESLDVIGLATKLIELGAIGLLLSQWVSFKPKELHAT